jgi:Cu(I)/Ag(I) efflux system membrane fusion protein
MAYGSSPDDRTEIRGDVRATGSGEELSVAPPHARLVSGLRWLMVLGLGALAAAGVARAAAYREKQGVVAHVVTAEARGDRYACPMHPSVVASASPEATCPICGMRLARLDDSAAADAPAQAGVGVAVTPTQATTVDAPATVAPLERSLVQLTGRFNGWLEKLEVNETGRRVERGQILALVYSPDLIRAQKTMLNARRWERDAQPNLQPSHEGDTTGEMFAEARFRVEAFGLDARDIETILSKGLQRLVPIRAPIAGVVIRKDAVTGGYVQPGAPLYTIADLTTVSVLGELLEGDLPGVRVGQPAVVTLRALPGESFAGKVAFVAPILNGPGGSAQVRVDLPNPGLRLRPGALATLRLPLDVPASSVVLKTP